MFLDGSLRIAPDAKNRIVIGGEEITNVESIWLTTEGDKVVAGIVRIEEGDIPHRQTLTRAITGMDLMLGLAVKPKEEMAVVP